MDPELTCHPENPLAMTGSCAGGWRGGKTQRHRAADKGCNLTSIRIRVGGIHIPIYVLKRNEGESKQARTTRKEKQHQRLVHQNEGETVFETVNARDMVGGAEA